MMVDEKFRIGTLIDKANESLGIAESFLESSRFEEAILSCYHVVFFTLRAFLKKNDIRVERTSESAEIFKKKFVDTRKIDPWLYEDFATVVRASQLEPGFSPFNASAESAQDIFHRAERFYSELTEHI